MKKVLVTGASGFIGRYCLPLLVQQGYEIHAVARQKPQETIEQDVRWHECDLLQPGSASSLVQQTRPTHLLHLAWYAVPQKFWTAPANLDWVRASLDLLRSFTESGGERIVAAGTCAEYAWDSGECLEAQTALLPHTLYGSCKLAFGQILDSWGRQTGLSSAWGRVFFLYGPQEHPSRVVAYVTQSLLEGKEALCSDGTQMRDFLHVEDVASAFVSMLGSDVDGPVNIGSGKAVALRDVLMTIGELTGRPELLRFGARGSAGEAPAFWANNQKLLQSGWSPRYNLTRGLAETVEWWRNSAKVPPMTAPRQG